MQIDSEEKGRTSRRKSVLEDREAGAPGREGGRQLRAVRLVSELRAWHHVT